MNSLTEGGGAGVIMWGAVVPGRVGAGGTCSPCSSSRTHCSAVQPAPTTLGRQTGLRRQVTKVLCLWQMCVRGGLMDRQTATCWASHVQVPHRSFEWCRGGLSV